MDESRYTRIESSLSDRTGIKRLDSSVRYSKKEKVKRRILLYVLQGRLLKRIE